MLHPFLSLNLPKRFIQRREINGFAASMPLISLISCNMQSSCRRCSNWLRYVPQPSVWLPPSLLILRSERPASMHIMQHSCSVYIFIRPSIHLRICVSSFINVHLNTCNTRRYIYVLHVLQIRSGAERARCCSLRHYGSVCIL